MKLILVALLAAGCARGVGHGADFPAPAPDDNSPRMVITTSGEATLAIPVGGSVYIPVSGDTTPTVATPL